MIRGMKFITLLFLALLCLTLVHSEDVETTHQETNSHQQIEPQVDATQTTEADLEAHHQHDEGVEGEDIQYVDQNTEGYEQSEEAQQAEAFAQYIKEADANEDGHITFEELHNFFVSFIVLDEVESVEDYVKTYFDMLDDDKDGNLTIDEFRALLETAQSAEAEEYEGEDGQAVYEGEQGEQGQQKVVENEEDL